MDKARAIATTVDRFATGLGFARDGDSWYREGTDIVWVLNLQKQHALPRDLDVGVWFSELGARSRPPEKKCHLRTRLSRLVADGEPLDELMDLDGPVDDGVLEAEISALLDDALRPLLDRITSVGDLASREGDALVGHAVVTKRAERLLPPR